MKNVKTILPGFLVVWLACISLSLAQDIPQRSQNLQPSRLPGGAVPAPEPDLSTNYRVTLSARTGSTELGELSALTCSPTVLLSGPIDASASPSIFTVTGKIIEREDNIKFEYSIKFCLVFKDGSINGNTRSSWAEHQASGGLLMKPSQQYEVLRAGGAIYTISISPEVEK